MRRFALLMLVSVVMLHASGCRDAKEGVSESARAGLLKRALKGDSLSQVQLGEIYKNGRGVPKDGAEAVKWYRKAADQGNAFGQAALGYMYAIGFGVPKDEAEAVKWFHKSADQGDAGGQAFLAMMYSNGFGVLKDETEAYKWCLLAGAQGHEVARELIAPLEKKLTPDQRAEGQRLAREFVPKKP